MDRRTLARLQRMAQIDAEPRTKKVPYTARGRRRGTRPIVVLEPRLHCFAWPQLYTTWPSSEPETTDINLRIVNSGRGPAHRVVVRVESIRRSDTTHREEVIALQPGESRDLTFPMNARHDARRYRVRVFDPLGDPITIAQTAAAQVRAVNILEQSVDPVRNRFHDAWMEYPRPDPSSVVGRGFGVISWRVTHDAPASPVVKRMPTTRQTVIATGRATPATSELRKDVRLDDVDLDGLDGHLASGDVLAVLDGFVWRGRLGPGSAVTAGMLVEFLDAAGATIGEMRAPSGPSYDQWRRTVAAVAVPVATEAIRTRLQYDRTGSKGFAAFDEIHLTLAHRQTFESDRIFTVN